MRTGLKLIVTSNSGYKPCRYNQAINQVKRDTVFHDGNHEFHKTINTLSRAKKVEELMELQKKLLLSLDTGYTPSEWNTLLNMIRQKQEEIDAYN